MKTKKFNGFNEEGCLPFGIYEMNIDEFENIFTKNKSTKRKEIMKHYKEYIKDIINSPYYLNHWIDGSYVTLKKNPNDIDLLTEYDGIKVDNDNKKEEIEGIIYDAPLKTCNTCHSFVVFNYPKSFPEEHEKFLELKSRILFLIFAVNKKTKNPKGFVKLKD